MAAAERSASLKAIGIRTGNYVDQVIFCFSDNTQLVWGHTGGNIPRLWPLNEGEYLVQINIRQGGALDAILFVTNRGRQSPWFGGNGGSPCTFKAAEGCEIVCLLMDRTRCEPYCYSRGTVSGVCNRLLGGVTPPLFMAVNLSIVQLDPHNSPSTGYFYGKKPLSEMEMYITLTKTDINKILQTTNIRPEDKERISTVLQSGIPFVVKQCIGPFVQKMIAKDLATMTGETIPKGVIHFLKIAPSQGIPKTVTSIFKEMAQTNSVIQSNIVGFLFAHLEGPYYAARGEGEKAVSSVAAPMLGLGAGLVFGGPVGFVVGTILAPLAIGGIFSKFGETASAMEKRWKNDQVKLYHDVTKPLDELLVAKECLKCPNGHDLVDLGQTTLRYLHDESNFLHEGCKMGWPGCMLRHERWQFRAIRFFCMYCAVCYCEPCILKHLQSGRSLPPTVLWT